MLWTGSFCSIQINVNFIKKRSASLSMVVLVLFIIGLFQSIISYSISFGRLDDLIPSMSQGLLPTLAFLVRGSLLLIIFILWILN